MESNLYVMVKKIVALGTLEEGKRNCMGAWEVCVERILIESMEERYVHK